MRRNDGLASGARSARPFFLAGGGTVGHLAPAFAIRDALRDLGRDGLFVTPGEAREAAWFPPGDPEPLHVPSPRFPRTPWQALAFPFRMTKAVRAAGRLLRAHRPAAVLALGGWPCAPTAIAARLAGVPVALLATDAVPGSVIRRMHRKALRTYLSREEALAGLPEGGLSGAPLFALAKAKIARALAASAGRVPVIGRRGPCRWDGGAGVGTRSGRFADGVS